MVVAPAVIVPARAEEEFYRLNNLAVRLTQEFSTVDLEFPDDEVVEDLAPVAMAAISGSYLLQEFVDAFFDEVSSLPGPLTVRRPDEEGDVARGAQAALLALKSTWAAEWSFERLWTRLAEGGPLIPPFRPLLVQPAASARIGAGTDRDAGAILGRWVEVLGRDDLGIVRLRYLEPPGGVRG